MQAAAILLLTSVAMPAPGAFPEHSLGAFFESSGAGSAPECSKTAPGVLVECSGMAPEGPGLVQLLWEVLALQRKCAYQSLVALQELHAARSGPAHPATEDKPALQDTDLAETLKSTGSNFGQSTKAWSPNLHTMFLKASTIQREK